MIAVFFICSMSSFTFSYAVTTEDSVLQDAKLVSDNDNTIQVNNQVMIVADLSNGQDRDQKFAYIVQIHDENDIVVSLSWLTGNLSPYQTFSPAQSWTPTQAGTYTVQIFVWESVDSPTPLSHPLLLTVNVAETEIQKLLVLGKRNSCVNENCKYCSKPIDEHTKKELTSCMLEIAKTTDSELTDEEVTEYFNKIKSSEFFRMSQKGKKA